MFFATHFLRLWPGKLNPLISMDTTTQYIVLILLWIAWCTLHSALVSSSVTLAFRNRFPEGSRYHRIVYNIVAIATLTPVLLYSFSFSGPMVFSWQGSWRFAQIALAIWALFFFIAGSRRYDLLQFLGIRQIKEENACSVLTDDCSLDTSGILNVVRHPWYTGGIFIIWARPLDMGAILTNIVVSGYFVVGAHLEERKLETQFGQEYSDYQKRVSMFLPFKWIAGRIRNKT